MSEIYWTLTFICTVLIYYKRIVTFNPDDIIDHFIFILMISGMSIPTLILSRLNNRS